MFKANYRHAQESLFNTSLTMDDRIKEKLMKSWAAVFYENVFCQIDEEPFSVLYGSTGNPNFPVNILLSLEYIKHMKDIPDIELMDDYYFDYLVNYAVGLKVLGEKNLAERTLYYFRQRIYQYCLENPDNDRLLFDQFINLLKSFALKAGIDLNEQRMDTTMFMSNIKKAGRLALAFDILTKAVKAIPEDKRTEELAKTLEPKFKTDILYRAKANENDSKFAQMLNFCRDALKILKILSLKTTENEVRILERFINEQSKIDETGRMIPKSNKEITSSSLQSAYDEDATYRKKAHVSQSGYVLEISETCSKENPFQFITDYVVEANNISDVEIIQDRLPEIKANTGCKDFYLDGGFHSPDVLAVAKTESINLHLTDMSGTEPSKKLSLNEYKIDEESKKILECPGKFEPIRTDVTNNQTTAHFQKSSCENCPLRDQCHVKEQKKDFVVRISLKAVIANDERNKIEEFKKENTSKRAAIEGTNSALKRKGLTKLRVRGKAKSSVVCALKVMAQNIKRFTKFMLGGYKPKNSKNPINGIIAPVCG
jgi:hypothetical protein